MATTETKERIAGRGRTAREAYWNLRRAARLQRRGGLSAVVADMLTVHTLADMIGEMDVREFERIRSAAALAALEVPRA